ncbi:MAG: YdiU family protein [Pirellulaceae bacterium]|nr:YdiU family protein [Pirellulaceae bacterium]
MLSSLDALVFDNRFVRELPADPEPRNFRRPVAQAAYSRVNPTPVAAPKLIAYAEEVGQLLDLHIDPFVTPEFAEVFGGNRLLPGMDPFAMCYGGHQFGNWAGQLGDGRAINLGEVINARGEHWTLQLKGAGPTPYSRTADGLAVLRSSVREFLCSEAMHHLGVPTTRALSLVTTGEHVQRDMFYDGNPQAEPGAVVCRVAPSFTRFGNFQIFAARGDTDNLRRLVEYTIRHDFPALGSPTPEVIGAWFAEVCRRTAEMVVHWMRVGFVHGVMNTDNMSILGLTIDYGPYGWLEDYDPGWTPNTTDAHGRRYSFAQQPHIAMWNLVQLANALVPLLPEPAPLQAAIDAYAEIYNQTWPEMIAQKLGLASYQAEIDRPLIDQLFETLPKIETDMTIFFRHLSNFDQSYANRNAIELLQPIAEAFYVSAQLTEEAIQPLAKWLRDYAKRLESNTLSTQERAEKMHALNPKYVLRNYLAQMAIDKAETGDASLIMELLEVLRRPYDDQPQYQQYAARRPEWARHRAGCSMLSCSS